MSVVWTLIAGFLYAEIVFVLLLVLPIFSPKRWARFFKSNFFEMLGRQVHTYFYILVFVLVLFLLEAIREMRKFSHSPPTNDAGVAVEMQHSMRLFRAQRNFYITGFAIFLVLVVRRLISLITTQAQLLAQSEASLKQAQSATAAARNLMKEDKPAAKDGKPTPADGETDSIGELKRLRERVQELTSSLNKERKDKEAVKSQAESINREYDRLTEEYSKLQKRVTVSGNDKDD